MSKSRILILAVLLLAGIAYLYAKGKIVSQLRSSDRPIPTTRVRRANVQVDVYADGDLRPVKSSILLAPPIWGNLQIIKLLPTGTHVEKDEVVLQFDPSEQEYKLEQAQSDLAAAQQEVTKSKADAEVQRAQDQVALLKAKFDVRSAELDVGRNELLSSIDAQKNNLALDEARRRLAQLQDDVKSRRALNDAALAVSQEKRNKAQLAIQQAEEAMRRMTIKAPFDGVMSVSENPDAMGGIHIGGMQMPEYREGDQTRPGNTIAEVYDPTDLEIQSKIAESDRANVSPGQTATVSVDAVPDATYKGKVRSVASMSSQGMFWNNGGTRKFDASFTLDNSDARLRPGESARITVQGKVFQDVLVVLRQAIFDRNGTPIIYVRDGDGFSARDIKIVARTESQVAIEGVSQGTEVALVDPEKQAVKNAAVPVAGPALGGAAR
jgi:HlyD family secretion protein